MSEDNYPDKYIVLFYFSGTGNTWWVAGGISKALRKSGYPVRTISLENIKNIDLNELIEKAYIVGLGYPVYGSDMPGIVKTFINDLPETVGKKAFVFCTQWLFSGDGAAVAKNELSSKGYDVLWMEHFNMPNNVCLSFTWFLPYTNDKSRISAKLSKNIGKIDAFTGKILKEEKYLKGSSRISAILGGMQRIPFRKSFDKIACSLQVDEEICIKCGECIRFCPMGNIGFKEGKTVISPECILCLRCYNFCPVSAVMYAGKKHNRKRGKPYKGPVDGFDPQYINEEPENETR